MAVCGLYPLNSIETEPDPFELALWDSLGASDESYLSMVVDSMDYRTINESFGMLEPQLNQLSSSSADIYDDCLHQSSPPRLPTTMPHAGRRGAQVTLSTLRLSPLESIEIRMEEEEDEEHRKCGGSSPQPKRPIEYQRTRGIRRIAPAPKPETATNSCRRSCKRQATDSAVDTRMYVCTYCQRHKTSSSRGQDGRVRIRCACGGKHHDDTPRMHAQWSLLKTAGKTSTTPLPSK